MSEQVNDLEILSIINFEYKSVMIFGLYSCQYHILIFNEVCIKMNLPLLIALNPINVLID